MNIVLVSQEYPPSIHGGIGTYTNTVAHSFGKEGHNVHVIALASNGHSKEIYHSGVTVHRIGLRYVNLLWRRPLRYLRLYERSPQFTSWIAWANAVRVKIEELSRNTNIDVVEAPDYLGQGLLVSWPKRLTPLIARLHNPATIVYPDNGVPVTPDLQRAMQLERISVKRSDRIISPSTAILQRLSSLWNLDGKSVDIIPCPVDTDLFSPPANVTRSAIEPIVLYVGRLSEAKGVRCLLDAAAMVLEKFPKAQFHFVGAEAPHPELGGISYSDYVAQGNHRGADRFRFHGRVSLDDLPAHYRAASLCVVPSIGFESFGITCVEAMACGRPLVATRVGGIPDLVMDGVTGRLIAAADSEALARAISELLSSPESLVSMGAAGRQRVLERYSIQRIVAQQLKAYHAAIQSTS
jgi:glycogen synthase